MVRGALDRREPAHHAPLGLRQGHLGGGPRHGRNSQVFASDTSAPKCSSWQGRAVETAMRPLAPRVNRKELVTYLPHPNLPYNCLTVADFKA